MEGGSFLFLNAYFKAALKEEENGRPFYLSCWQEMQRCNINNKRKAKEEEGDQGILKIRHFPFLLNNYVGD